MTAITAVIAFGGRYGQVIARREARREAEAESAERVGYFAYEQYEPEPWLCIMDVSRRLAADDACKPLERTRGVLIHKENVRWHRVIERSSGGAGRG